MYTICIRDLRCGRVTMNTEHIKLLQGLFSSQNQIKRCCAFEVKSLVCVILSFKLSSFVWQKKKLIHIKHTKRHFFCLSACSAFVLLISSSKVYS